MGWIRLSDDYVQDEKFQALSDGAFRLWHEALAHCRRHQTDGLIPFTVLKNLPAFTKSRERQLAAPARDGLAPLWEVIPATGYKVHNYLAWNPSKDEENERRSDSKDRMRLWRERRQQKGTPETPLLQRHETRNERVGTGPGTGNGSDVLKKEETRARSKRPIFSGQRLTVFDWMLDDLMKMLGNHADSFDLHEWFFELDRRAVGSSMVIPQRDGGAWLQAQTLSEAQRRGLPIAIASAPSAGKLTTRLAAALAHIKADAI